MASVRCVFQSRARVEYYAPVIRVTACASLYITMGVLNWTLRPVLGCKPGHTTSVDFKPASTRPETSLGRCLFSD